jgi:UDP-N-acetylmuramate--alanine ligase
MHIYFSGIGGTGLGPLALIAKQAGFTVSGSDKQHSHYIDYLRTKGIENIHINQTYNEIAAVHTRQPIDWFVYTTAVTSEQQDPDELRFCKEHHIRISKRDELLNHILTEKNLKLIAIAGTHGKTTTTAMAVWLFQQLSIPVSYSIGAKTPFSDMGLFDPNSEYFVYEADEYARNFLAFHPYMSLVTGVDWDHPDIYPTREEYDQAFRNFIAQSAWNIVWEEDITKLGLTSVEHLQRISITDDLLNKLTLPGIVNRKDALQVIYAVHKITNQPTDILIGHMNHFPGVSRRFEQIIPGLYTDYAHTPPKIRGALQVAKEVAGENVVVVYEGLHNTRQHFIKKELVHMFDDVKQLYIVPSYLAREDPNLALLTPDDLRNLLSNDTQAKTTPSQLDGALQQAIKSHLKNGELVLCLTAGGGNSLDEWLRKEFTTTQ